METGWKLNFNFNIHILIAFLRSKVDQAAAGKPAVKLKENSRGMW